MGVMYSVARNFPEAAAAFGQVVAADPKSYVALSRWGACLSNAGEHEAAISKYDAALSLNPGFARCWLNRGISCFKLRRYEDSVKSHLRALALNPDALHIWYVCCLSVSLASHPRTFPHTLLRRPHVRIGLTCMERFELVPATHSCDLPTLLKALNITT